MLLNPKNADYFAELDGETRDQIASIVNFFESKGKARLLAEYYDRTWYSDFIEFLGDTRLLAKCLAPTEDDPGAYWNTRRNAAITQTLAFYSVSHWYAWQVSILGLGPIWMSSNNAVKQNALEALRNGGVFAFGLSEREHGADIYATRMTLTPAGDGRYTANGRKYYIGNANKASIVTTFARNSDTGQFVFYAVERKKPGYRCIKNTVPWQGYVAELELQDYAVGEEDILSVGDRAWDDFLNTVNIGKFNVGCAGVGVASHAFHEALNHSANRILYGSPATDMPHIRKIFADAFARISASQMYADRAVDYMRCASADDRRYLLFDPLTKMKVNTQCARAINEMWDAIAARGFEKDMYFEQATNNIQKLVKLEGTVHVNMALVVKFMQNYFFSPKNYSSVPKMTSAGHDAFMFDQGPTRGLGDIRFHDYRTVYAGIDLPNVLAFRQQIDAFVTFLDSSGPDRAQMANVDFRLGVGECFALVAYGQLILEQANLLSADESVVDYIFDVFTRDFSEHALQLISIRDTTDQQRQNCSRIIRHPVTSESDFARFWNEHVVAEVGRFEMNA